MLGKYVLRFAETAGWAAPAADVSGPDDHDFPTSHRQGGPPSARPRSRRIEDAVAAFKRGEMIIVVDDEDRENEGDLTLAAEKVTPEAINFMATHGRGLICLAMTGERLDELEIPLMVNKNTARLGTAFCVSIEAKARTSTGISAADRAATVLAAIDPATQARRPRAARATCSRCAPAAAACWCARGRPRRRWTWRGSAGMYPAGRHLRNHERGRDHGARPAAGEVRPQARPADDHHRRPHPVPDADRGAGAEGGQRRACPPSTASSAIHAFESVIDQETHVALVRGDIGDGEDVLVRVHSKCLTGDVFHSARCDCGPQLHAAMQRIAAGGPRRAALPEPGGPRHRPGQQDPRLRVAGPGLRHRRGQRAAGLQGRPARLRHRRADPARTWASGRCGC